MATAKKLPSGNWRVLVYTGKENGKRQYKSFTAPTKKEAELAATMWTAENHSYSTEDMTLHEAYRRYIDSKQNILSPRTVAEYKKAAARDFPDMLDVKLSDMSPQLVQEQINIFAKGHSPKSTRNAHGLLSAVLGAFVPALKLTTTLPQKRKTSITVPTDAQIKALLTAADNTDIEAAIILAALGSLRRSEVCAVTENDIDREAGIVTVNKAIVQDENNQWVIKTPKSFAGYRQVQFPIEIMDKIKPVEMSPDKLYRKFKALLKGNNLPDMRFHDLRHYQASILHALGVPDKYIMQRGGWTTDSTLKNIYQHTMKDKQEEFDRVAVKHFSDLLKTE